MIVITWSRLPIRLVIWKAISMAYITRSDRTDRTVVEPIILHIEKYERL